MRWVQHYRVSTWHLATQPHPLLHPGTHHHLQHRTTRLPRPTTYPPALNMDPSTPITCPAVPNSAPAPTPHRDDTPVSKNRTSHVTETRRARATPHNKYTGPPRYVPPALCNNIKTSYRSQHTQSTRSQVVYNMYI